VVIASDTVAGRPDRRSQAHPNPPSTPPTQARAIRRQPRRGLEARLEGAGVVPEQHVLGAVQHQGDATPPAPAGMPTATAMVRRRSGVTTE
jgi:hypothetical protein